jgi:CHAD domain-containing protein
VSQVRGKQSKVVEDAKKQQRLDKLNMHDFRVAVRTIPTQR